MAKPLISVLGAGLMGHGIAWIFADAGHPVHVFDPDPAMRRVVPDRLGDIAELLGRNRRVVETVRTYENQGEAVAGAAFVFEAAPEKLAVKREIFQALAAEAPEAILCSNTSALPITAISEGNPAASRIVGTHFWNPPHLVPLVEVVEVPGRNAAAVTPVMDLLHAVGRHPVHVRRDVPGFIGNRLQHALKREAIALVAAGVCDAETVDDVVKFGFGKRLAVLGPLEQSDLVGLDLTLAIHETLMPDLDRTNLPHPYLRELVGKGSLGMKAGRGFRSWTEDGAAEVHRRLADFLVGEAQASTGKGTKS